MAKKQTFLQTIISAGMNLHPSEFEAGIQAGMQIVKENKKKREGMARAVTGEGVQTPGRKRGAKLTPVANSRGEDVPTATAIAATDSTPAEVEGVQ